MTEPSHANTGASSRTVAITGANGMVGRLLTEHFLGLGWWVHALQRCPLDAPRAGLEHFAYALPEAPAPAALAGVEVVVHGAVQLFGPKHRDADALNLDGARRLLASCRAAAVPVIFLSSLAAHADALSHYGRSKFAIEAEMDTERELTLRLGLVLARGGLFDAMARIIRKLPVVPVLGGGRQPLQTVFGPDLCRAVEIAIRDRITGALTVATPEPDRMIDLYRAIAAASKVRRVYLPVPVWSAKAAVSVASLLGDFVEVSNESLLSLQSMIVWSSELDLRRLGMELTPMWDAVGRLA